MSRNSFSAMATEEKDFFKKVLKMDDTQLWKKIFGDTTTHRKKSMRLSEKVQKRMVNAQNIMMKHFDRPQSLDNKLQRAKDFLHDLFSNLCHGEEPMFPSQWDFTKYSDHCAYASAYRLKITFEYKQYEVLEESFIETNKDIYEDPNVSVIGEYFSAHRCAVAHERFQNAHNFFKELVSFCIQEIFGFTLNWELRNDNQHQEDLVNLKKKAALRLAEWKKIDMTVVKRALNTKSASRTCSVDVDDEPPQKKKPSEHYIQSWRDPRIQRQSEVFSVSQKPLDFLEKDNANEFGSEGWMPKMSPSKPSSPTMVHSSLKPLDLNEADFNVDYLVEPESESKTWSSNEANDDHDAESGDSTCVIVSADSSFHDEEEEENFGEANEKSHKVEEVIFHDEKTKEIMRFVSKIKATTLQDSHQANIESPARSAFEEPTPAQENEEEEHETSSQSEVRIRMDPNRIEEMIGAACTPSPGGIGSTCSTRQASSDDETGEEEEISRFQKPKMETLSFRGRPRTWHDLSCRSRVEQIMFGKLSVIWRKKAELKQIMKATVNGFFAERRAIDKKSMIDMADRYLGCMPGEGVEFKKVSKFVGEVMATVLLIDGSQFLVPKKWRCLRPDVILDTDHFKVENADIGWLNHDSVSEDDKKILRIQIQQMIRNMMLDLVRTVFTVRVNKNNNELFFSFNRVFDYPSNAI